MNNKQINNNLHIIISTICKEKKLSFLSFCQGWVMKIDDTFIYGFNFPLNNASSWLIANDKYATSDVLKNNNILCFEHLLLTNDNITEYERFLNKNKCCVVKPLNKSLGKDVYLIDNNNKNVVNELLNKYERICYGKFYKYDDEYRIVLLDNKVLLYFCKKKNNDWKNNLANNAIVDTTKPKCYKEMEKIAIKAAKCIKLKLCAVDLAIVNNKIYIVEINTGIMLEKFSSINKKNFQIAKNIYEKIIKRI